jgi:prepilin-type N-terminal cleavage/methylation domain-containing protein
MLNSASPKLPTLSQDRREGFSRHVPASDFRRCRGVSLVELIVCIGILAILGALAMKGWQRAMAAGATARCMENMRSLQVSLNSYIQDKGHWPQVPEEIDVSSSEDDSAYEDWWLEELEEYGGTPEVWQCPVIKRLTSSKHPKGRPKIHYTPTPFDEKPMTPYRWSTQPWLVEIGNMHGRGALLIFPDGSIKTLNELTGRSP